MQKLLIIVLFAVFLSALSVAFVYAVDKEGEQAAECSGVVGYERVRCENNYE